MEIIKKSEVVWTNTNESGKDILMTNAISGDTVLIKNESSNEEIESMYFCDATKENYDLLTNSGFIDINNCFKFLDNKHHIRFYLDKKTLHWESVGSFCLNTTSRRATFEHVSTLALKDILRLHNK